MALGGLIVAPFAGVVALLVVPALFALLGTRIDALPIRRVRDRREGGWYRFAHGVRHRPLPIAVATAAVLVALGLPFLGVRFTGVDASVLPESASARQVQDAVHSRSPEHVVVRSRATLDEIRRLPGVAATTAARPLGGGVWTADVTPRARPMTEAAKELDHRIRALPGASVGGVTAWYLDTSSSLRRHLPLAGAILALTVILLLYLVTRSAVLPLKAIVMNAVSLCAAFGVLVWVFQDGRLEGVLHYQSQGALELTQPILLFAIAFGLATDYGVFLLSRIREAHESGLENREAVALGLERTGRVVTAAALLFCVAVGSFATSEIVLVKEIGVGIALAVAIDASLVRALLVPSLMALLGDWNWWRPGRGPR
jgi:RND superfamily putative drug exporter